MELTTLICFKRISDVLISVALVFILFNEGKLMNLDGNLYLFHARSYTKCTSIYAKKKRLFADALANLKHNKTQYWSFFSPLAVRKLSAGCLGTFK